MHHIFQEKQKFTQWWLWVILIGIGLLKIGLLYQQLILGETVGDNPMPNAVLVVFALITFAIIALFLLMKLKTSINKEYIEVSFYPFTTKKVYWHQIEKATVLKYGFIGGWGIRFWTKYGTVYNVKGNKGLAIQLKNGDKFLIGTQKATELKSFLEQLSVTNTEE